MTEIITHANCADGMASAMILSDVLHDASVKFLNHNSPEHITLKPKEGQLFCDFVPIKDRISEFVDVGTIILDHHRGTEDIVNAFEDGIFAYERQRTAGAGLAYDYVWTPLKSCAITPADQQRDVFTFSQWSNIRDTWQRKSFDWTNASIQAEILLFYPAKYWLGLKRACLIDKEFNLDQDLYAKTIRQTEAISKNSFRFKAGNLSCAIFPSASSQLTSDITEILHNDGVNVMRGFSYFIEEDKPKIKISIRSDDLFDTSKFAQSQGSNGHSKAAAFLSASCEPYSTLQELLDKFLLTL